MLSFCCVSYVTWKRQKDVPVNFSRACTHVVKTHQWNAAITLDKRRHNVVQTLFDELTKKYQFNNVELQGLHDVHTTLLFGRISFILKFFINIKLYLIVEVNIPNFTRTKL